MTTTHQATAWFGGDDWQINATLLDENGNPFDLSAEQTEIKWCLLNSNSQEELNETDVTISIVGAAAGQCSIMVPATVTSPLAGGKYTDFIRIVIGGITSTLSTGSIYVTADPWMALSAAAAAVASPPQLRRLRVVASKPS